MIRMGKMSYMDKEILKDLRLRVEMNDPLYHGQKKLVMRGRDLRDLPQVLFSMLELEVLDLSPSRESCLDFRLPIVPPSIGKLINLKILMLDTNELYSLPKEISLLHSLERVSFSNNHLTSLPHGIAQLKNLRSMHLGNNKFEAFPLEIVDVESLQFLDISDNLLVSIPEDISKLENLRTLLLNYNKIMQLPDGICELTGLECLWVCNNRLKELPRNFGKLVNLDWGYRYTSSVLEKNPLLHPPIEICREGPKKINQYFEDLDGVRAISTPEFEQDEGNVNDVIETDTEPELSQITSADEQEPSIEDEKEENAHVTIQVTSPSVKSATSASTSNKKGSGDEDILQTIKPQETLTVGK